MTYTSQLGLIVLLLYIVSEINLKIDESNKYVNVKVRCDGDY